MKKQLFLILAAALLFTSCNAILPRGNHMSGLITTVAGHGTPGYWGDDGQAIMAQFYYTRDVAVDSAGNFYIADSSNDRIRKVDSEGIITTVAGDGTRGYYGDTGPATQAQLCDPYGVAVDSAGNLYIADSGNNRLRKVDTNGIISTVAGDGTQGFSGDNGLATSAKLTRPQDVAVDSVGNIYIIDTFNNRIRKVGTNGMMTTVVGNSTLGYSGDGGPAASATICSPEGIGLDSAGNLYIADTFNYRVRKVDRYGIITTVAGDGTVGYSGDNGPAIAAQLNYPMDVAVDTYGNLYITDSYGNNRIRKVDINGIITTIAGNGTEGYEGDNGPATSAQLNGPEGVTVDSKGNLYIADCWNHRIRKVWK